jgi:hypothetical protein
MESLISEYALEKLSEEFFRKFYKILKNTTPEHVKDNIKYYRMERFEISFIKHKALETYHIDIYDTSSGKTILISFDRLGLSAGYVKYEITINDSGFTYLGACTDYTNYEGTVGGIFASTNVKSARKIID